MAATQASNRRWLISFCAALIALAVALTAAPLRAEESDDEEGNGLPPAWSEALEGYARDPEGYRAQVLAIEREAGATLPPQIQVYIADAYLRSGRPNDARRVLEKTLEMDPQYPWDVFANLGMGSANMMLGDPEAAAPYFETIAGYDSESSRLFGHLGLGHALLASDRPMDAKEAFDAAGANKVVDDHFRQAGKFGSGIALYEAGDYEGAAKAFDALAASDPKGQIGLDARYAAARARIAGGDQDAALASLEDMESRCATVKKSRRAPRALRNLSSRAFTRAWLRNYQRAGWYESMGKDSTMYSIGGCDLARATLREVRAGDGRLRGSGVQQVAGEGGVGSRQIAQTAQGDETKRAGRRDAAGSETQERGGSSWLAWGAGVALAAVAVALWLRRRAA